MKNLIGNVQIAIFKTEEMPTLGFAPDAEFPCIHGEKGITNIDPLE